MQFELSSQNAASLAADAVVHICFSDDKPAPELAGGLARDLYESGDFAAKSLDLSLLHRPAGFAAGRLLLAGGGERAKFDCTEMRKLAGAAVRTLRSKSVKKVAFDLSGLTDSAALLAAAAEGALLGQFEPDKLKTEKKNGEKRIETCVFVLENVDSVHEIALERGRIVGEAQNYTRMLVNEPSNLLPPLKLAEFARETAEECGLGCEILDEAKMKELGMGALLGVAQGSAEPPVMIILRYTPEQAPATSDHLALVGKGVTFDTGGISIKPSDGMEKMKYDMAGAATVIGAMRAIAQLKPAIPVTALAPCVENMPGSRAQRPGDIVTSYQGKTIEVTNTDAEGRLILADALTYAARQGCTHLVNAATLTGGIVVALGHHYAGVFSNNDALQNRVIACGKAEGERMWPFPMDAEYRDYLKTAFADINNVGGRSGGSISAAKFLEEFVEGKPWVHIDIAGTAWLDDGKAYMAKGPTGLPLRTFVRLALDWQ